MSTTPKSKSTTRLCQEELGGYMRRYECGRSARFHEDARFQEGKKWFCGTRAPSEVARRRNERAEARYRINAPILEARAKERRLHAAAPVMREALEQIQSQCAGHADEFSRRVSEIASAALVKAEGR
jgi:hypothetical protein